MNKLPIIIIFLVLILVGLSLVSKPANDLPSVTEPEEDSVLPTQTVGEQKNQEQPEVEIIDQTVKREIPSKPAEKPQSSSQTSQTPTTISADPTQTVTPPLPPPPPAPVVPEIKIVSYTDSGFNPSTVSIKKGETVRFKNDSSANMWVASNVHPAHSDYSGFDALRSYGQAEIYSFTFDRTGSWNYHNHVNPGRGGQVVVE